MAQSPDRMNLCVWTDAHAFDALVQILREMAQKASKNGAHSNDVESRGVATESGVCTDLPPFVPGTSSPAKPSQWDRLPGLLSSGNELACVGPVSMKAYAKLVGSHRSTFLLMENEGVNYNRASCTSEALMSPAWNDLVWSILKARGDGPLRRYRLPPHLHTMLSMEADLTWRTLLNVRRFQTRAQVMAASCNLTLVSHLIENPAAPKISEETARNAAVLVRWLLPERTCVLRALSGRRKLGIDYVT